MNRRSFLTVTAAALLAASTQVQAKSGRVEQIIALTGSGKGKARYRVDSPTKRTFTVEVEKLRSLAGQTLNVIVISGATTTQVTSLRISSYGTGKVERKTERGHSVPMIVAGDIVELRLATDNTLVQSGQF
ncbi:MAG: hypothetical protein DWH91_19275 [Planctomycetota bacterium]|nr:MAG: hypothetical protein DWH91_19275 [Planctomycetota bacterium]